MGVSGCGKTTVGQKLAERLGWKFYDADDFHPPENIAKMSKGIPLTDDDRHPWLKALHGLISRELQANRSGVLTCSALKERYRRHLMQGNPGTRLVYLKGSYELILERMQPRRGHYMKPEMLHSQFEDLEEPADALTVTVEIPPGEIVDRILTDQQLS